MSDTTFTHSSPIPTRASKQAVHDFAEKMAKKLSFKPGDSMSKLIEKLGGRLEVSDPFAEDIEESIEVRGKRDFTIFISNFTSGRRDRFTIAHELGHYLLHYPKVLKMGEHSIMHATRWVNEADKDQMRAEWEANWFAAAFLMPKEVFEEKIKSTSLQDAANFFDVSMSAAKIRAKSLGLTVAD